MCNWPNREAFLECFYPAGVGLRTKEEKISDLNQEICDYLKNNNYLGHTITKNDYDIIAKEISWGLCAIHKYQKRNVY